MKTWLSGWRSGRNNKITYKLLVDQTDSHRQFGGKKVRIASQSRGDEEDDEDAAYVLESGGLLDEKYRVSISIILNDVVCGCLHLVVRDANKNKCRAPRTRGNQCKQHTKLIIQLLFCVFHEFHEVRARWECVDVMVK